MSNTCCSVRFCSPLTMGIFGNTMSGKTVWVKKLIEQSSELFEGGVNQILLCYGMYQPLFEDIIANTQNLHLHAGLPTNEMLTDLHSNGGHNLVILDDLQQEMGREPSIEKMFTQMAHHMCMSIIFLGNNLFHKPFSRTITINLHVLVLFRNARDAQQINYLGRQLYPLKSREFYNAYLDSTSKPYGYLIVDLCPKACEEIRLRTNIFKGEDPIIYKL